MRGGGSATGGTGIMGMNREGGGPGNSLYIHVVGFYIIDDMTTFFRHVAMRRSHGAGYALHDCDT